LSMYQRREEEKRIKMFLIRYDSLYRKFKAENNKQ
jgi:hypothetical protein